MGKRAIALFVMLAVAALSGSALARSGTRQRRGFFKGIRVRLRAQRISSVRKKRVLTETLALEKKAKNTGWDARSKKRELEGAIERYKATTWTPKELIQAREEMLTSMRNASPDWALRVLYGNTGVTTFLSRRVSQTGRMTDKLRNDQGFQRLEQSLRDAVAEVKRLEALVPMSEQQAEIAKQAALLTAASKIAGEKRDSYNKTTRKLIYLLRTSERKHGELAHANGKVTRLTRQLDQLAKVPTVATQQEKQKLVEAAEKLAVKAQSQLIGYLEQHKWQLIDTVPVSDKTKRETLASLERKLSYQQRRIKKAGKQVDEARLALDKLGYVAPYDYGY